MPKPVILIANKDLCNLAQRAGFMVPCFVKDDRFRFATGADNADNFSVRLRHDLSGKDSWDSFLSAGPSVDTILSFIQAALESSFHMQTTLPPGLSLMQRSYHHD